MANDLEAVIDEARQQANEVLQDYLSPLSFGLAGLLGQCSRIHQLIVELTPDEAPMQAEFLPALRGPALARWHVAAQRRRAGGKALMDLCHFTACVANDVASQIAPVAPSDQQAGPTSNPEAGRQGGTA